MYIPPNVIHGAKFTKAGILNDVSSPIREDFMEYGYFNFILFNSYYEILN